jgi:dTDP-4-amino-4,6-dideoxygalactose transaminase
MPKITETNVLASIPLTETSQDNDIYVTQPYLPPLDELLPYLETIWERKLLTNNGPFHEQLEQELAAFLRVPNLALFASGTIALVAALQALRITGEVITTPYSFVATAHSLLWNKIKPVFVDIDPVTLNIDPTRIEAAITPQTTAILPVHCYGNPCDVAAIQEIANNYNLKVIYDAAHAFGVESSSGSILEHGDLSVVSFHATKVFNTFEGGAIVCPDEKTKVHIDHLKNFGFVNETTVVACGINGKMHEFSAALGLLQLKHFHVAMQKRKHIDTLYREHLEDIPGIHCLPRTEQVVDNFAYFPILVEDEYPMCRDDLFKKLESEGVFARRYFYPLISSFPMYRGLESASPANLPVASRAAEQVICLPIYPDLDDNDVFRVVGLIGDNARVG